jgi:endonuclease YncB( thermonuclease family)
VLVGCARSSVADRETATVERVGDGDSLDVSSGDRVRLVQLDAPELGERECYAREAQDELERLAPPGASIELEADPDLDATDRFDRLLRYVHRETVNVNVELVRRGAATPYFFGGAEGLYADELLDAVEEARRERRGMWTACRVEWRPDRPVSTRPG